MKTLGVQRFTRARYPVERSKYNNFAAHHFMYMANVVQNEKPKCFDEVVETEQSSAIMDEEMNAPNNTG